MQSQNQKTFTLIEKKVKDFTIIYSISTCWYFVVSMNVKVKQKYVTSQTPILHNNHYGTMTFVFIKKNQLTSINGSIAIHIVYVKNLFNDDEKLRQVHVVFFSVLFCEYLISKYVVTKRTYLFDIKPYIFTDVTMSLIFAFLYHRQKC